MPTLQILYRLGHYWMSLKWKHNSVYKFTWFLWLWTGWSIFVIVNLSLSLRLSEPKSLMSSKCAAGTAAPSAWGNGTLTLWTHPKDIWAPHPTLPPHTLKPSAVLKAEITVRNQKTHAHTLSKSPFPSLPITVSSLRCNTVAQPDITHQQERQIPALWDSCFVPRITNWIVWGSVIYLNTKMQSYSLLLYEVSTLIFKL